MTLMQVLRILRPPPLRVEERPTGTGYLFPLVYGIEWAWAIAMRGMGLAR